MVWFVAPIRYGWGFFVPYLYQSRPKTGKLYLIGYIYCFRLSIDFVDSADTSHHKAYISRIRKDGMGSTRVGVRTAGRTSGALVGDKMRKGGSNRRAGLTLPVAEFGRWWRRVGAKN